LIYYNIFQEIMKVRGFQVAPAELEGHLLGHPAVADVCVVGVPDEYSGELPLAFVILEEKAAKRVHKDPKEEQRIKVSIMKVRSQFVCWTTTQMMTVFVQHVSDAKVQYKWLAGGVEFTDVIPKNPSGKILRRILRERAKTRKPPSAKSKL
jgi:4-coumarate--CoA ligase